MYPKIITDSKIIKLSRVHIGCSDLITPLVNYLPIVYFPVDICVEPDNNQPDPKFLIPRFWQIFLDISRRDKKKEKGKQIKINILSKPKGGKYIRLLNKKS
jgi:hypothetical protein